MRATSPVARQARNSANTNAPQAPANPELILQTVGVSPVENAQQIIRYLIDRGFLLA